MKKFYLFLTFLAVSTFAMAQTQVTFAVDMNAEGASMDGVFVTGNWMDAAIGGGDWQEPGSNAMAQMTDQGDGLFLLTVTLPAGDYQYKYANGTGWPNGEAGGGGDNYQADLSGCGGTDNGFGGYNRNITVPDQASFAVTVYEFNSCTESALSNVDDLTTISNVTIAPNPARDYTMISYANPNSVNHDILITSMTGQIVKRYSNIADNYINVNTADFASGMYFVTFRNEYGEFGSKKFLVQ